MTESLNIFLIEPNNKSKYKTMIVFADSPEEARAIATAQLNPAKIKIEKSQSPLMDTVYLDNTLSTRQRINVTILQYGKDTVGIKYLDNQYYLTKGSAKALND